jgi:MFS family permease
VVAAFSVGAGALAPLRGRLVDRHGRRALLPFAGGYALALVSADVVAARGASVWPLAVLAGLAGASAPPLVAALRAAWSSAVEAPLVRRGYALTSIVGDTGAVAAPALASALFVVSAWAPLAVCAAAAVWAATSRIPHVVTSEPGRGRPPAWLLAVSIALGTALGLVEIGAPAAAAHWNEQVAAGPILAAFALGSIAGGLWAGRRPGGAPRGRYLAAVTVLGAALAPAAAARDVLELAAALAVAGLAFGPATIALFEALDAYAPASPTAALTWVTTAEALGTAVGAAAAGALAGRVGEASPFAAASAVLVVAAVTARAATGRVGRVSSPARSRRR